MLSPEVLNRLPSIAFWLTWAIFIGGFALSKLGEAGMLGPLGRWFQRRAKERKRQRAQHDVVDSSDYRALQRRITALEKLVLKLEAQIQKLELVEESNAAHQDMTAEYLREDAQWHIDAGVVAVEEGFRLPPHRSYIRFVRDYREKRGLEIGRRWADDRE